MEADSLPACCAHAEENARLRRELADTRGELEGLRRALAEARVAGIDLEGAARARLEPRLPVAVGEPHPTDGRVVRVHQRSSRRAKLALYRTLFAGRSDVYARRFHNRVTGTSGWWPVHKGGRDVPRAEREYLPLTEQVIAAHLEGRDTIGLYPLLTDDTCRLLACDFDKTTWRLDVQAYCEAAEAAGVPAAVELSRSGNGAHVWTFFTGPVPAADARAMGAALLREAIALRGELDLDSYDRFFPSQDDAPFR